MNKVSGDASAAVGGGAPAAEAPQATARTARQAAEGTSAQPADPQAGGSYTRDPATGALTKTAGPVPADQPDQE
jgi:hypothetical protein